jgi:hypothetical protein
MANYTGKIAVITPIKGTKTPLAAAYLNNSGKKFDKVKVTK